MEMTAALAREIFRYEDGKLFWRIKPADQINIGDEAGTNKWHGNKGRYRVGYRGKVHPRARVIWMIHHGDVPKGLFVDHINNDCTDDRIENLQAITPRQNVVKEVKKVNGLPTGVFRDRNQFRAQAYINGTRRNLGNYKTPEEAAAAYQRAISLRVS